ncbi:MAG: hypothetical protein JO332_14080 [Planctomycetaceae bacterium]|nr:hypothetical protein [Planctomycetaceae bacterium]
MFLFLAAVLLPAFLAQEGPEERVDDTEYDKYVAVHVKALDAVEKTWKRDSVAALKAMDPVLKAIEADLTPRLPRVLESVIAVKVTRGIDKGEIKERRPFFPYRLAGEIALAAGEPERAVELLQKSPSSAARLEEARKAVAAKKAPTPPPPPPQPPAKPTVDLRAFLDKRDYAGALEAIKAQRAGLGAEADKMADEVRREAAALQKSQIALLAGLLPRLDQENFRKDHVEACLQACARVPEDGIGEELRWVRRLDRWLEKREPAEFERLALDAAKFGGDFTVLCDRAQDARIAEAERLVKAVSEAERAERPKLLDQLGQVERSFLELVAAHERGALKERFAALKLRLPIDDKILDEARAGLASIPDIRRIADELDRLWVSERRARLSVPDQKDLGLYLGIYRCMALFLDGRTIDEASRDLRLREVFRGSAELPASISPKVAAVRARLAQ